MPEPVNPSDDREVLVLITGTGRSGTSTMSGSLHHLGLHVPGPFLGANDSNPKGFYESRWAVRFHKQIIRGAGIHDMDSRPNAFERTQAVITPEMRGELVRFLRKRCVGHPQSVVKDPRSVWAQDLWHDAATEAGLDVCYISMLRHPAEVVGSRSTYYAPGADEEKRRRYEIFNVARWVNNSIVSERETRGRRRSFVRYNDLLEDWRPAVRKVADELGLRLEGDLSPGRHHPVDDFIDPDLRRVRVTWDDVVVPDDLKDLAQETWDQLMVLHAAGGHDDGAEAVLDELADRYVRLFDDAAAIAHDAIDEAFHKGRAAEARDGVVAAREAAAQAPAARGPEPGPAAQQPARQPAGDARPVGDVGGRELLRIAAGRALGRVRRR